MRAWLIALAAVSLGACGAEDTFAPATLAGTYELQALDAQPAPIVMTEDATTKIILAATLQVSGYAWWIDYRTWLVTKAAGDTTPVNSGRMAIGSWSGSDPAALAFVGTGTGQTEFGGPGAFDRSTGVLRLTITGSGLGSVFTFLKQ